MLRRLFIEAIGGFYVRLGYGEKGMDAWDVFDKKLNGLKFLWWLLSTVWFFAAMMCLMEPKFSLPTFLWELCIFPIPYLIFVICARCSVPSLCKKAAEEEERLRQEEEKRREEYYKSRGLGSWYKDLDY